MADRMDDNDKELHYLRRRVEHLEEVNRWHVDALGMLTLMEEVHGDASLLRDPLKIFASTRQYLKRVVDFPSSAFFTVNEADSSFRLADTDVAADIYNLHGITDHLIDTGKFAWAINQNRPVEVRSSLSPHRIILHVLTTKTRVRGMFLGIVSDEQLVISSPMQNLISVILNNSAYALESAALYQLINDHNQSLEKLVVQRTRELEFQYAHDSLTGLPNRLLFQDRLEQAMERARGGAGLVVVMIIDLDMFKRINDTLGHAAGDQLLRVVAERLKCGLRDSDALSGFDTGRLQLTLARLGGDEFAILLSEIDTIDTIPHVIRRVVESLSQNIALNGEEIYTTCSIGISVYPKDGEDTDTLLKNADAAMYHAKRLGRNHYQFYEQEINEASFHHLKLENQLRFAIEREEFFVLYQPKIDLRSGRVCGVEALVRWDHPELGVVSPVEFIPIAEYTGLITIIGEYVLRTACEQVRDWLHEGFDDFRMAVNLSPQQFRQHDLLERMLAIINEVGIETRYLEVEITEGVIMEDVAAAIVTMQRLHELGIALSIDDFGTGYSSLSFLKRFPIDTLKIDRSFVNDITTDSADASIVIAIIGMAHNMGLKVIAEGVEGESQLIFLRALKCDEIQGYLISPPVSGDKFRDFFLRQRLIP
ncbi:MAG: EAL domain-containing protein [Gammaproteobacteria bacterium]|nr:EAL domain-containing protein [Gammaproteobacteria bacterium]